LLERPGPQWADSWSPDGRYLIFEDGPGFSRDLLVLPIGGEPKPLVATRFNERGGVFSPDGLSFACVSDEWGSDEIYVQPFPGPGRKVPISINGGRQPVWSRDGRELFYRAEDSMMVVAVQHGPFRASAPRKSSTCQVRSTTSTRTWRTTTWRQTVGSSRCGATARPIFKWS
jgi:hypothetical protein